MLDLKTLKKHPSLIPLFAVLAFGALGSSGYTLRCALRNPDVTWSQKKNPEPWNEYKDRDYKFFTPASKGVKSIAPTY